jgi:hypothetical protein
VELDAHGADNFASLQSLDWQVHVYGDADGQVTDACRRLGLTLSTFSWSPAAERVGLARDATYLVRPDGYVAMAAESGAGTKLAEYFESRGIRIT